MAARKRQRHLKYSGAAEIVRQLFGAVDVALHSVELSEESESRHAADFFGTPVEREV